MSITDLDAHALSQAIHQRQVSCRDVMTAYLGRIHALNPSYNAIVNLVADAQALREADVCDAELAKGQSRGWMHGMPQAIKDAAMVKGLPTTFGSPLNKDAIAPHDGLMASRMRAAGAVIIGKTNMPEFGLGSHTFNTLFGATRNAYDPVRSAGGSSGGSAVALALRLLPVADGSDFMGSLRNPAGWNNIFGMRPSQGRVPMWPSVDVWTIQMPMEGPMGRNVADTARLMAVQAGPDLRAPLSRQDPFNLEAALRIRSLKGLRVCWLGDLGGYLATEDGILASCEQGLARMTSAGAIVEPAQPSFSPEAVWQAWLVWRRALVAPRIAGFLQQLGARAAIKPEVLWEHDQAQSTSVIEFMQASSARTTYLHQFLTLFDRYDVLALPTAQVWPFAIEERWPKQIAGRAMDTYHRWMETTIYATLAGAPAISVPVGFDAAGRLPAGMQLIARPGADAELLAIAGGYEQLIGDWLSRRPPST